MRPTLPPAPPIRQPYWHGGHTLTVDDFSYGIGMLAALAVAGTSACAAGAILHAQTCHVQAAPGLQVPSARQAPTSTGDRKGLPMSRRRACQPPSGRWCSYFIIVSSTQVSIIFSHVALRIAVRDGCSIHCNTYMALMLHPKGWKVHLPSLRV